PLNTSSESIPASCAPAISVSNRSPTTNGRCQPAEVAASNSEAACGLPATVGCTPVAVRNTAAIAPLPGNSPRSLGSVASVLHTNHHAPSRTATHASASSRQPVSGSCPCTTAATPCAACRTGRRPTSPTIPARASVPSTSTFAAGANRCASNCAAAYELVYTSCVSAAKPAFRSLATTSSAVRAALLVTNRTTSPRSRTRATAAGAPSITSAPRYNVPSRSSNRPSYGRARSYDAAQSLISCYRCKFPGSLGRIGLARRIHASCSQEPTQRLLGTPRRHQIVGI